MLLVAPLALCLPFFSFGQQDKLSVAPPDPIAVKRGATAVEKLKLSISPGLHVNSDKPADEFLIPLSVTWSNGPLEAQSITYPAPEQIRVGEQRLSVFTGSIQVETAFKAPAHASSGPANMTAKIRYQACNDQMCFRPAIVEVRVPVSVE